MRSLLGIGFQEYSKYANFKQKVLIKAKGEINSGSDLLIDFEEFKKARKVESIKFIIKASKKPIDEVCATIEDKPSIKETKALYEAINAIKAMFKEDITRLQAKELLDTAKGDINIIKEKYEIAEIQGGIKGVVGWMIKAIKKDYQAPKNMVKVDNFNNYEQRPFDPTLESKLLGWGDNEKDEVTGEEYQQGTID